MLNLATGLSLPLEVVTQKLAWIGTGGSGKTYGASKLAELLWHAGAQFVVIDPVGVWYGLRLSDGGRKPSEITVPIFGGLHGDLKLESTSGALVADFVVERSISVILDVSQFESDSQKARFSADFADRFFFRKKAAPSAVHVFIEECQEFVPENQQRGEERMLHAFTRLQKIGRNFGIGTSLITQRPQDVAKKALNLASTLFVFRTTGIHERHAIERWIRDKAIEGQDIAAELPKLKTGAPHVWSPEWLDLSKVVTIHRKQTFNASATPAVGKAAVTRRLAHIEIAKLSAELQEAADRAKQDDPTELRKEIARLKKQQPETTAKVKTKTIIKRPLISDGAITKLGKLVERVATQTHGAEMTALKVADLCTKLLGDVRRLRMLEPTNVQHDTRVAVQTTAPAPRALKVVARRQISTSNGGAGAEVGRSGLRRMLVALAQAGAPLTKRQLAIRSVLKVSSGTFGAYLSRGRKERWIEDCPGGLFITDKGERELGHFEPLPRGRDLYLYWLNQLGGGTNRMLQALGDQWPRRMTKAELGAAANLDASSGTFGAYMSKLRGLGLAVGEPDNIGLNDEVMQ